VGVVDQIPQVRVPMVGPVPSTSRMLAQPPWTSASTARRTRR
jgi:hypothetical protein